MGYVKLWSNRLQKDVERCLYVNRITLDDFFTQEAVELTNLQNHDSLGSWWRSFTKIAQDLEYAIEDAFGEWMCEVEVM